MIVLSAMQARVAGCLMEKETTTPEYYPLSLHALVNACNQKSSREPVMELSERDVRGALTDLEDMGLVRVLADARVPKFEHRMRDGLGGPHLRRDETAVLCLLLLRGPQTPAELRARADRLYSFDDTGAVQSTLERLAGRDEPMTRVLARQPGAREARWSHLLCGEPVESAAPVSAAEAGRRGGARHDEEALLQRITSLEEQLRVLGERVEQLERRG